MAQPTQKPAGIYEHVQAAESDTWVIIHNQGQYPAIDIYIDYQGEKHKILPLNVVYNTPNQCTVTFSSPRTGFASVA